MQRSEGAGEQGSRSPEQSEGTGAEEQGSTFAPPLLRTPAQAAVALLIFLGAWAHGILWATVVPPWQAPDEPLHVEYARLLAEKGPFLTPADISPGLQEEILRSLAAHRFWEYLGGLTPDPLPVTFAEAGDFWLRHAGTQVTDEPPLYYGLPALFCRLLPGIERQLWAIRVYSAALSAGVALFGWLTARELWPTRRMLPLAVAAWLGFHPMAAFIGASANNDALVNLGGAALAFTLVRGCRRGWNGRRLLALAGLAVLLPLSKKSGLIALPLAAAVLIPAALRLFRVRVRPSASHLGWWPGLVVLSGLLLALGFLAWQPVPGQAAAWGRRGTWRYPARSSAMAHSGTWALSLPALQPRQQAWLVQSLPANQVRRLQGQEVTLRLWAWAAGEAQAQVAIDDGGMGATQIVPLQPRWQAFELRHRLAADAERLRVVLAPAESDRGSPMLFFDDLSLRGPQGELLRNGSAEAPKRRWEGWMADRLRLPLWFGQGLLDPASYDVASLRRYGFYLAVTFGNFWGDFGWLTLPLPLWAYVLPALATLGAVIGWRWAGKLLPERWQRQALAWLGWQGALIVAVTFLPMIGRIWQPQGRYLFPGLVPWAVLFTAGWSGWGTRLRWRRWWLVPACGMALLDAGSLLGVVIPYYYR
ncbi:MAG: DUF2142 domain-containing protein [Anaerolineae bacterium]|nr:DUF2142 domain-containing protein [Anaerolineae bacterium]